MYRIRDIENRMRRYFAMTRGEQNCVAMEMTKWFNTNYHYVVPELDDSMQFSLDESKIVSEYQEAAAFGIHGKTNIIGTVTFLGLSKTKNGKDPYSYYDKIIPAHEKLFSRIAGLSDKMDEPVFVRDSSTHQLELLDDACRRLGSVSEKVPNYSFQNSRT